MPPLPEQPGLLFVAAALLPLAAAVLLLLAGCASALLRPYRDAAAVAPAYRLLGGTAPGYVALAASASALLLSLVGAGLFFPDQSGRRERAVAAEQAREELARPQPRPRRAGLEETLLGERAYAAYLARRWAGSAEWLRLYPGGVPDPDRAAVLRVGFRVDGLTVLLFVLVTLVATLAHLVALALPPPESPPGAADGWPPADDDTPRRRDPRRFFPASSLLCFAVLGLVLADNLLLAFAGWQLAGAATCLLVGLGRGRLAAPRAALRTFVFGRVGDAGILAALGLLGVSLGTLDFEEMAARLRAPRRDAHGERVELGGRLVRAEEVDDGPEGRIAAVAPDDGGLVLLMPRNGHVHAADVAPLDEGEDGRPPARNLVYGVRDVPRPQDFGAIPYGLLTAAGLGLLFGCAARAAQVPLHAWFADAAGAPAPAVALTHAAAAPAGVYLLARCYPLLTPGVLLTAAYCGAATLVLCTGVAAVKTDLKRGLACAAGGQLGLMTLGLGVGGWSAALAHLLTCGCATALLFLGAGVVLHAARRQNLCKMGGLLPRLPVTAWAMLAGVLVLAGVPPLGGWYSHGAVLAAAYGFAAEHPAHAPLFVAALAASGLTAFALFRLWFLAFAGEPRGAGGHAETAESPPAAAALVVLAMLAAAAAWPAWGDEAGSWRWPLAGESAGALEGALRRDEPASVAADFRAEAAAAGLRRVPAAGLGLGAAALGALFAALQYRYRVFDAGPARDEFPRLRTFLASRVYSDGPYRRAVVRPVLMAAAACRAFDPRVLDAAGGLLVRGVVRLARGAGRFDRAVVGRLADAVGAAAARAGPAAGAPRPGPLRRQTLLLVLAAAGAAAVLTYLAAVTASGRKGP